MTLIQAVIPTVLPARQPPLPLERAFPGVRFRLLVADPPWRYRDRGCSGAVRGYSTMMAADLAALPVPAVAAEDSVLALWATAPLLPEALALMAAWGFEYVTVLFTWLKTGGDGFRLGLGRYTRSASELVLLGRRGRGLPRLARDVEQVIAAPVRGHSVKPPEALERLERLFGRPEASGPYLELFARSLRRGWQAWGDEVGPWPEEDARPPEEDPLLAHLTRESDRLLRRWEREEERERLKTERERAAGEPPP